MNAIKLLKKTIDVYVNVSSKILETDLKRDFLKVELK